MTKCKGYEPDDEEDTTLDWDEREPGVEMEIRYMSPCHPDCGPTEHCQEHIDQIVEECRSK